MISKPITEDVPAYYNYYIGLSNETDLLAALKSSMDETLGFIACIPSDKEEYRYADGKWTLKEVLRHVIDTERIFAYRALRFSRKDATELPGFDENSFNANSNASSRKMQDMAKEFKSVREASISLYEYMNDDMLDFKGKANNNLVTSRGIGWMIVGHNIHHCKVMRERYLDI